MSLVEMQTSVLPSSFPLSETRPSQPSPYLEYDHRPLQYAESPHSSKENRTPPSQEKPHQEGSLSPQSFRNQDAQPNGVQLSPRTSPQHALAGKKRDANGAIKELGQASAKAENPSNPGHSRNTSTLSTASNPMVTELSQQLRTRLTYAMLKVQNGWQDKSLDEVESVMSASPRSTTFNHYSRNQHLLSPRAAMTAHLTRQSSESSDDSLHSAPQLSRHEPMLMSPPPSRKGLAPPANIVSRATQPRRRPTPNVQVQATSKIPLSSRPATHRTPSQNAVLEADAVETLLFMASPNNSGKPSSKFSPMTSATSVSQPLSQISPIKTAFSAPTSPKQVVFATNGIYHDLAHQGKNDLLASVVEKMDEDGDADLDEALMLIERHHAAKLTT